MSPRDMVSAHLMGLAHGDEASVAKVRYWLQRIERDEWTWSLLFARLYYWRKPI